MEKQALQQQQQQRSAAEGSGTFQGSRNGGVKRRRLPPTSSTVRRNSGPRPSHPSATPLSTLPPVHTRAHTHGGVTQTRTLSRAQGGFLHLSDSVKSGPHSGRRVRWRVRWRGREVPVVMLPLSSCLSFLLLLFLLAFIHSPWLRPSPRAPESFCADQWPAARLQVRLRRVQPPPARLHAVKLAMASRLAFLQSKKNMLSGRRMKYFTS